MQIANASCCAIDFIHMHDRKSYLPLVNCVIKHVFTAEKLTNSEKLYYILADLYAHLNESLNGLRETEKSGYQWAKLLGCSEEWVFQMQKKLEAAGFFHIIREKDEDNQNEKNIIIPTLPDDVFTALSKEPNRIGKEYAVFIKNNHEGCKRSFLDSSKLFVKFNLKMIKLLLSDDAISSLQKLIWLHFFCRSHIAYTESTGEGNRNFIATHKEIAALFSCSEKTVSAALLNLTKLGYITKKQFRIKEQDKLSRRKKKSCWEVAALFPKDQMEILLQQKDRQKLTPLTNEEHKLYGLENEANQSSAIVSNASDSSVRSGEISVTKGDSSETSQYYNKDHISNSYINKNNDQTCENIDSNAATTTVNNVFIEQELTATEEEITNGLEIAEKFDSKVFELAKNMSYEDAIKQADLLVTQTQRWIVTKAAYTLHKNQSLANNAVSELSTIDEKNSKSFSEAKQRLIFHWKSFPDTTEEFEGIEEFLTRKSWLLKLLNPVTITNATKQPQPQQQAIELLQQQVDILSSLPNDKRAKARKFAYTVRERGRAKGYSAEISEEALALEFIYHAATWVPERLNCKTRAEQIDAALSFAWRAAETGRWKCPYQWLNLQIEQREQEARQRRNW